MALHGVAERSQTEEQGAHVKMPAKRRNGMKAVSHNQPFRCGAELTEFVWMTRFTAVEDILKRSAIPSSGLPADGIGQPPGLG